MADETSFDDGKLKVLKEFRVPDPWDGAESGALIRVYTYDGSKPKVNILRYYKKSKGFDEGDNTEVVSNKGNLPMENVQKVGELLVSIGKELNRVDTQEVPNGIR